MSGSMACSGILTTEYLTTLANCLQVVDRGIDKNSIHPASLCVQKSGYRNCDTYFRIWLIELTTKGLG